MTESQKFDRDMRRISIIGGAGFLFMGTLSAVAIGGAYAGAWGWFKAGDIWFGGMACAAMAAAIIGGAYALVSGFRR